jgi:hypothetical protein
MRKAAVTMENKNSFTFTGLCWMKHEEIQRLCKSFALLSEYGIKYDFRVGSEGTRFVINGYDDILENRYSDDTVTFLKKVENNTDELSEDVLVMFSVNDDMQVTIQYLHYDGTVRSEDRLKDI